MFPLHSFSQAYGGARKSSRKGVSLYLSVREHACHTITISAQAVGQYKSGLENFYRFIELALGFRDFRGRHQMVIGEKGRVTRCVTWPSECCTIFATGCS